MYHLTARPPVWKNVLSGAQKNNNSVQYARSASAQPPTRIKQSVDSSIQREDKMCACCLQTKPARKRNIFHGEKKFIALILYSSRRKEKKEEIFILTAMLEQELNFLFQLQIFHFNLTSKLLFFVSLFSSHERELIFVEEKTISSDSNTHSEHTCSIIVTFVVWQEQKLTIAANSFSNFLDPLGDQLHKIPIFFCSYSKTNSFLLGEMISTLRVAFALKIYELFSHRLPLNVELFNLPIGKWIYRMY